MLLQLLLGVDTVQKVQHITYADAISAVLEVYGTHTHRGICIHYCIWSYICSNVAYSNIFAPAPALGIANVTATEAKIGYFGISMNERLVLRILQQAIIEKYERIMVDDV